MGAESKERNLGWRGVVLSGAVVLVICSSLAMGSAFVVGRAGVRGQISDTGALCSVGARLFGTSTAPVFASDWLRGLPVGGDATAKIRAVWRTKGEEVDGIAPYGISRLEREELGLLATRLKGLAMTYSGGAGALGARSAWWNSDEGRVLSIEERVAGSGVISGCEGGG